MRVGAGRHWVLAGALILAGCAPPAAVPGASPAGLNRAGEAEQPLDPAVARVAPSPAAAPRACAIGWIRGDVRTAIFG